MFYYRNGMLPPASAIQNVMLTNVILRCLSNTFDFIDTKHILPVNKNIGTICANDENDNVLVGVVIIHAGGSASLPCAF